MLRLILVIGALIAGVASLAMVLGSEQSGRVIALGPTGYYFSSAPPTVAEP